MWSHQEYSNEDFHQSHGKYLNANTKTPLGRIKRGKRNLDSHPGSQSSVYAMRCVTVQLSDPLHVWKSIREHSRPVCVRLQLRLPSALSDTVYLLQSPPVLSFPLGFTLAQSHKLRWEASGGGLCCHTNKHRHNQDPEKVQWESRCHFSHVALRGTWRLNLLIILFNFFSTPFWGSSPGRGGGKTVISVLPLNHHNPPRPLKQPLYKS